MTSLIVLTGGLFAVLIISTLLYYYRKYKSETEARFVEIRLLVKSAKEHQNHISKQLLDIMKVNKDDLTAAHKMMEEQLKKMSLINQQKMEESWQRMMDQLALTERKNEQRLNVLKESLETQIDVLKRGLK